MVLCGEFRYRGIRDESQRDGEVTRRVKHEKPGPDIREDRQQTELSNAGSNIQIHGNQRQIHSLLQAVSCYPRIRLPRTTLSFSFSSCEQSTNQSRGTTPGCNNLDLSRRASNDSESLPFQQSDQVPGSALVLVSRLESSNHDWLAAASLIARDWPERRCS